MDRPEVEPTWGEWRPMAFGRRPPRTIRDPLVEPLWPGRRVIVRIATAESAPPVAPGSPGDTAGPGDEPGPRDAAIRDEDGLPLAGEPALRDAMVAALATSDVVLDGYLLELPRRDAAGAFAGSSPVPVPGLAGMAGQLILGGRAERRVRGAGRTAAAGGFASGGVAADRGSGPDSLGEGISAGTGRVTAFVAIDLLAIDGDPVLDVPLLERKRLLDSVLTVNERVRRGPHVRPPVEAWYGQWRAFGFRQLAVKAANSPYLPGRSSNDWAIASIPRA